MAFRNLSKHKGTIFLSLEVFKEIALDIMLEAVNKVLKVLKVTMVIEVECSLITNIHI